MPEIVLVQEAWTRIPLPSRASPLGEEVNSPSRVFDVKGGIKRLRSHTGGMVSEWKTCFLLFTALVHCEESRLFTAVFPHPFPRPSLSASPGLGVHFAPAFASWSWLLCLSFSFSSLLPWMHWALPLPCSPKARS